MDMSFNIYCNGRITVASKQADLKELKAEFILAGYTQTYM